MLCRRCSWKRPEPVRWTSAALTVRGRSPCCLPLRVEARSEAAPAYGPRVAWEILLVSRPGGLGINEASFCSGCREVSFVCLSSPWGPLLTFIGGGNTGLIRSKSVQAHPWRARETVLYANRSGTYCTVTQRGASLAHCSASQARQITDFRVPRPRGRHSWVLTSRPDVAGGLRMSDPGSPPA